MINTHILDTSYENSDIHSLSKSLSDFVEVVTQRRNDGISRFTYDEQFYCVEVSGGKFMSDIVFNCLDRQLTTVFLQTIAKCHSVDDRIDNYTTYQSVIEKQFGIDGRIHEFSFWGVHFSNKQNSDISSIEEEYDFHCKCLNRNLRNDSFGYLKELCFPNLKFKESVSDDMKVITGKIFNNIVSDLSKLDKFCNCIDSFNWGTFKEKTGVDISDESDTVKKSEKLKGERRYSIPNVGSVECYLHIKTGYFLRTYIYFDENKKHMWILEIGKHKHTAKF